MKNPVIVALDLNDPGEAERIVDELKPFAGGFKIGPRLSLKTTPSLVKKLSDCDVFFLDHKFFDIPSTTCAAVTAAAEVGADWVTVHALNGPECLTELAAVEKNIRRKNSDFRILVVTVLTSFSEKILPPIWKSQPIGESVRELASSAYGLGLKSFVCSSDELKILRSDFPDSFLVVPGIRPAGSAAGDQKRVASPARALELGASALVIGRPITEAADRVQAAKSILEGLR